MDILIYNWKDIKNPDRGGAEVIVYTLAKNLIKDGHSVTWFARKWKGCPPEEMIDGIKIVRRGNMLTTYFHGWRYYRSLPKKPDLVIDMLNTIFWQTPLYTKPSVTIAYVNQLAKEVLYFELPKPLASIGYFLEKFQFFTYRKTPFLCYAQSTKNDLTQIGIPSENISLFPLGLDHRQYFAGGEKTKTPTFIVMNRLVRMKRPDLAIEAMRKVVDLYPESVMYIIGFGYFQEHLQKLISDLKLENNVLFKVIPFLKESAENEKTKLIQSSWALIFPSVKEGWGMTVTESAACGTPSIVTNVTGLRDSVKKDETGLTISADPSADELAENMCKLIKDGQLRQKLSENSIKWAAQFTWEKSYESFKHHIITIYERGKR